MQYPAANYYVYAPLFSLSFLKEPPPLLVLNSVHVDMLCPIAQAILKY